MRKVICRTIDGQEPGAASLRAGSTSFAVLRVSVASVYGLVSTPTHARFRVDFAGPSLVLGILASLAGAWFPARAASQLDPTLALHNIVHTAGVRGTITRFVVTIPSPSTT